MANTFELIASSTVGSGGAASFSFTSIPATYTDLMINISARVASGGSDFNSIRMTINGSTANQTSRTLFGDGAAASSSSASTYTIGSSANGSASTANTFSNIQIYIPNYAGSNNKSMSLDYVAETNATTAYATLQARLWSITSAITDLSFDSTGVNFAQYTTAYLYGIKNS